MWIARLLQRVFKPRNRSTHAQRALESAAPTPALPQPRTPAEHLAATLTQVNPRLIRRRTAGWRRIWYRGDEPYFDVFFDVDEHDALRWFQLTLRGKYLEWNAQGGRLETGITNERQIDPQPHAAVKLARPGSTVDRALAATVLEILAFRSVEPIFAQTHSLLAAALAGSTERD